MNLRSSVKREALEDASEQDTKAENIPLKPDNSNVQERGVSGLKERETKVRPCLISFKRMTPLINSSSRRTP